MGSSLIEKRPEAFESMLPYGDILLLSFTWVNFEFGRNFRHEQIVAVWPVSCFRWKPLLLIPSHLTSGLPGPRGYRNKVPQFLAHCHVSVVWWAAMGNITPCRVLEWTEIIKSCLYTSSCYSAQNDSSIKAWYYKISLCLGVTSVDDVAEYMLTPGVELET